MHAAASERTRVGTGQPLSRGGSGGKSDLRQAGPRCITLQKSGTTTQAALTHMPVAPCTKMLHLQQDFLGGVSRAAGRQESSYNTRVEEMVPGKRSSRVTLKYQEEEGFGGPVAQSQRCQRIVATWENNTACCSDGALYLEQGN